MPSHRHAITISVGVSAAASPGPLYRHASGDGVCCARKKYGTKRGGTLTEKNDLVLELVMTLKQKKKDDRVILDSVRGIAKPGRMLAVMGPSGSGKSTFLHSLAGRVKQDKKISLSGRRYINGTPVTGDTQIPAAFIEQDVNFFPHLTVKETLDFRVELQMASVLSKLERDDLVAKLMSDLGLTKSANTIVGNTKVRGLSGGERKRLSIACEMIGGNSVLMLDEPTSGLDSYQAAQVLGTLRNLADQGKTVIAVIHQPSQHTFQLFDDLLLLSEGKMMYYGEVSNVRNYMAEIGYEAEAEVGTAEHILNCISSIVGGDADAEKASVARIEKIAAAADAQSRELVALEDGEQSDRKTKRIVGGTRSHPGANIMRQFSLLLRRSLKEIFRGKAAIIIKVMQQVSLGLIYGGIYTLGLDQSSIMDRFGLLSLIMIGGTNMAVAGTIRAFPKEKAIVSGEMDIKLYRTFPYFIAKAVSELPLIGVFNAIFSSIIYPLTNLQPGRFKRFLAITTGHGIASEAFGLLIGSISPNSDVALALMPPIVVLNIIFDGKNISEENTPWILKWVNKVGLIRWGFTGLALNEFEGLEFTAGGRRGPLTKTGEEALSRFGLDGQSIENVFTAQTKIVAGCWLLSYLGLSLTKQKFEVMAAPSKREKE
ncbi:hypothetical protein THAOC_33977 [Thalassiosira oceanica]|uniref:ABC transporter domain-containing protein n=1 Tax=Thalassiosira oceanica TaxID=159749 RepID=K0R496_THAOC|nr:hypothetical protein THAOC_33977 [Thalassiosira oceanica]|eukprot:EJK47315.1 hypothetical protein THAOC_33977 [Thalassiosira oceanica]